MIGLSEMISTVGGSALATCISRLANCPSSSNEHEDANRPFGTRTLPEGCNSRRATDSRLR